MIEEKKVVIRGNWYRYRDRLVCFLGLAQNPSNALFHDGTREVLVSAEDFRAHADPYHNSTLGKGDVVAFMLYASVMSGRLLQGIVTQACGDYLTISPSGSLESEERYHVSKANAAPLSSVGHHDDYFVKLSDVHTWVDYHGLPAFLEMLDGKGRAMLAIFSDERGEVVRRHVTAPPAALRKWRLQRDILLNMRVLTSYGPATVVYIDEGQGTAHCRNESDLSTVLYKLSDVIPLSHWELTLRHMDEVRADELVAHVVKKREQKGAHADQVIEEDWVKAAQLAGEAAEKEGEWGEPRFLSALRTFAIGYGIAPQKLLQHMTSTLPEDLHRQQTITGRLPKDGIKFHRLPPLIHDTIDFEILGRDLSGFSVNGAAGSIDYPALETRLLASMMTQAPVTDEELKKKDARIEELKAVKAEQIRVIDALGKIRSAVARWANFDPISVTDEQLLAELRGETDHHKEEEALLNRRLKEKDATIDELRQKLMIHGDQNQTFWDSFTRKKK